jgi:RecB family exonuclease
MERFELKELLHFWPTFFKKKANDIKDWIVKPDLQRLNKAVDDGLMMIESVFKNRPDLLRRPYFRDVLWVENKFEINIDGFDVIGFFDLVLPQDDGVIIVDWKTGGTLPKDSENDEINSSSYKDQLQLYSLAARFYGLRVKELQLYFPRLEKNGTVRYNPTREGYERQAQRVKRVRNMIENHRNFGDEAYDILFPYQPSSKRCMWCVFKDSCEGFREQEKKNTQEGIERSRSFKEKIMKNKHS